MRHAIGPAGTVLVLAEVCLPGVRTEAAWQARPDVRVLVHDTSSQSPAHRSEALALAGEIVASTGTVVTWHVCGLRDVHGGPQDCAARTEPGTLHVRIMRAPRQSNIASPAALGYSVMDPSSRAGVLATVFYDRVDWRATQALLSYPYLLGRVIAHELGHLILATNEHTKEGLMRERWTMEELRAGRASDWRFSPRDIASIQTVASLRTTKATAAPPAVIRLPQRD